jgi:hypothetical protein
MVGEREIVREGKDREGKKKLVLDKVSVECIEAGEGGGGDGKKKEVV